MKIKFRGKRVDSGKYVYGHYYCCDWKEYKHYIRVQKDSHFKDYAIETPEQFINIYDINGKEIYEGDIVEHETYNERRGTWEEYYGCEVVYSDEEAMFCFESDDGNLLSSYRNLKVVGNIHEKRR